VGRSTSITIGADSFPVISYYDSTNGNLKVAKCGNASCSAGNTLTTVDSGGVGQYTSITIGADGFPVISYYDSTNSRLKVAKCDNASCSSGNTLTTVDSAGVVGWYISITIGTDGFPVISYYDNTNHDLKVAKCVDAACSGSSTITTVDSAGNVGEFTSITIGADGFPVISYYNVTNGDLKVAKCVDAACSGSSTITTVDSVGFVGWYTSITVGADDFPVISYYDSNNTVLKVAKCGNASCSAGNTLTTVDSGGVGQYTSITIGADGFPVISYYDATNGNLKVAKCANEYCLNSWWRR
jgi:cell shape-determining protein MreC